MSNYRTRVTLSTMIILLYCGSAIFFIIGFICLIVANRNEPPYTEARKQLAERYNFVLTHADRTLMRYWRRGALFKVHPDSIINIASGVYRDEQTVVCDIRAKFTVIAIHRANSSSIVIDIRGENQAIPHANEAIEMIAGSGKRVIFSNNEKIANKIIDHELLNFLKDLPSFIQSIWSEGAWALATIPLNSTVEDCETAIQFTRNFSDLMSVLPPKAVYKRSGELV